MSEVASKGKQETTRNAKSTGQSQKETQKNEKNQLPSTPEAGVLEKKEKHKPAEPEYKITNPEQMIKVLAEVFEQEFSGPIPPPNIIAGYENVIPGAADRIIQMAERQSLHRQEVELMEANAESRDSLLGIIFAFALGTGCLVACVVMVLMVPTAAGAICGSVLGVTGIAAIVTAFLQNTRRSEK